MNMAKIINPYKPHVVELPDGGFAIRLYRLFSAQFLTEFGTYTDCVDNMMIFKSHWDASVHMIILNHKKRELKTKAI